MGLYTDTDPRRHREYTDDEFCTAVATATEHQQPATTREIAEMVGCSASTARNRLTQLSDEERIERTTDGRNITLWSVPRE